MEGQIVLKMHKQPEEGSKNLTNAAKTAKIFWHISKKGNFLYRLKAKFESDRRIHVKMWRDKDR